MKTKYDFFKCLSFYANKCDRAEKGRKVCDKCKETKCNNCGRNNSTFCDNCTRKGNA